MIVYKSYFPLIPLYLSKNHIIDKLYAVHWHLVWFKEVSYDYINIHVHAFGHVYSFALRILPFLQTNVGKHYIVVTFATIEP